jgi:hypothetical protein
MDLVASNYASLAALREGGPVVAEIDRLQVQALSGRDPTGFAAGARALAERVPVEGRLSLLLRQAETLTAGIPRPLAAESFLVLGTTAPAQLTITAVSVQTGRGRAALIFVDNTARDVYGERYLEAPQELLDLRLQGETARVLGALREEHGLLSREAAARGLPAPSRDETSARLRARVATWVASSLP